MCYRRTHGHVLILKYGTKTGSDAGGWRQTQPQPQQTRRRRRSTDSGLEMVAAGGRVRQDRGQQGGIEVYDDGEELEVGLGSRFE